MTAGYVEFEFDLPEALLAELVRVFERTTPGSLLPEIIKEIPEEQGVYQLLIAQKPEPELVYIGKTDAAAGLRVRLSRHARKIQQQQGLDPKTVLFKAVRVYVFTAVDLEAQLIDHYGGKSTVRWNGSGFGSNDPGIERDTTTYKKDHFDAQFPIDVGLTLSFSVPMSGKAADILRTLKRELPYLIRFQSQTKNSRVAHRDLEETIVTLDPAKTLTAESVISQIIQQLHKGWHATLLPSHIVIYKDDTRTFRSGRLIQQS